ncbi:O-antigen ligase family protein [Bdellovibrio bacteriovorus]|uniref:O-antigen ligase family protein n=1 Tax=Bdellovibrio bacteriovorus TaxID=959 RepID=UPI003AA997B1
MSTSSPSKVLTLLTCFVPLSLALNLVNFFWMDIVFVLVTIGAFYLSRRSWAELRISFGFQNKILMTCLAVYAGSGILGYFLNSSMSAQEWNKIADLRWIFGLFACLAVGRTIATRSQKFNWLFVTLTVVFVTIIIRHYQITGGQLINPDYRLQGYYSNPNYFALAVVIAWSMLLAFVFYAKNCISRSWAFLALMLATITLIGTYTRTSWIGMLCVLAVALFYARNKKALIASCFGIALFAVAIFFNFWGLKQRILYTFDFSDASSQLARLTVWKVTWHLFLDHPVFGVGFENAAKLYPAYYIKLGHPNEYMPGHAHNQFLSILSGAGIIGLAAYLGLFGSAVVFFHRKFKSAVEIHQKQLSLGALLCIVALFACSWTETPLIQHEARNYILILLGFSYGYLDGVPAQQPKPLNEPV